ncbi:K(+)/H(+) antiporter NhaP [Marinomonas gallaica]|uniref:K(+)/H(+) antiporter NhaP n=1 Tax=Marinomonas gallaica TaxID=1806667 RepID=A0A1C3JRE0_9GAMM|nr:potassium/proton antiporter [Marinomonas gallaica]SBT17695.1 K(+)/H(+) antiporter NhaP [Marinomonas gallaica]SBT20021.1 K(+)/H(+) antiporter NhaP [Marinomonas gallaica]
MTIEISSQYIFLAGLLALLSILASVLSSRLGTPLLLVFLIIGMLAGEDGIGGIHFDDAGLAFLFGNLALATILLDGGLGTRRESFAISLKPAFLLATVGVLLTAGITASAVYWLFGLPWKESLLLGAIIGSTDAAAVFGLIRNAGLRIKERTGATLEVESGANDPMAIFLTITMVSLINNPEQGLGWSVLVKFIQQMGLGLTIGVLGGLLLKRVLPKLHLASSLYPLLVTSAGLSIFGITNLWGGSGFLAIYIVGVILGNANNMPYKRDVHRFHDGMAWLSQIGMFLMLGLLVTPSEIGPVILPALAIGAVLIFIARPVAVLISLLPFHFPWREQLFISWCGLRGAVPIILAMYPSLSGVEQTPIYFNFVFVVVIMSLVLQGWTIPQVARWLKIELPDKEATPKAFSITFDDYNNRHILIYEVPDDSDLVGCSVESLPSTPYSRPMGVMRGGQLLVEYDEVLRGTDKAAFFSQLENDSELNRYFTPGQRMQQTSMSQFYGDFVVNSDAKMRDIAYVYFFRVEEAYLDSSVKEFFKEKFHGRVVIGDRYRFGEIELTVREFENGEISKFGLKIIRQK